MQPIEKNINTKKAIVLKYYKYFSFDVFSYLGLKIGLKNNMQNKFASQPPHGRELIYKYCIHTLTFFDADWLSRLYADRMCRSNLEIIIRVKLILNDVG